MATILPVLNEAVIQAAGRADVLEAVVRLYADLQAQIDLRRPVCNASGRCCQFDEFGHRLYVTTLELAAFVASLPPGGERSKADCPFQIRGLCSVHTIRPFGCRVFFCDATSSDWQHQQYDRFHARLKRLHGELNVPYFYVEWREALKGIDVPRLLAREADPAQRTSSPPKFPLSLPQLRL
jgi:Fe-S-cluster containining protein